MHYIKCEQCQELFKEKEQLIRHNFSEELIKTIENDSFEELKVEHFRKDEACVGVYSSTLDQDIPIVHLHSEECWNGWGHSCPILPGDHKPDKKLETSMLDYNLCLHMEQTAVISVGADCVNWETIVKIIEENL